MPKQEKYPDFYRWCNLCCDYFPVGKHDHDVHERIYKLEYKRPITVLEALYILIALLACALGFCFGYWMAVI